MEKQNLTQQKHTFTNQNKCTTTQKIIARFSRLLRHLAWKWRGPILVLAIHKSVTYLLRHSQPWTYKGHLWQHHDNRWRLLTISVCRHLLQETVLKI